MDLGGSRCGAYLGRREGTAIVANDNKRGVLDPGLTTPPARQGILSEWRGVMLDENIAPWNNICAAAAQNFTQDWLVRVQTVLNVDLVGDCPVIRCGRVKLQ